MRSDNISGIIIFIFAKAEKSADFPVFLFSQEGAVTGNNKKAIVFAFLHQRWLRIGAADEARTRYLHLGKVALYQMSYGRISGAFIPAPSRAILANFGTPAKACGARFCGEKEKIWYSSQKSCLQDFPMNDRIFDVVPPIGIEPMTRGFSVPCSTD